MKRGCKTLVLAAVAAYGAGTEAATPEQLAAVRQAFGRTANVSETASGDIYVRLWDDVERTVRLSDDLGAITVDMNGEDIEGTDGADGYAANGSDGLPGIAIYPSGSAGSPTVLTVTSSRAGAEIEGGEGGDGKRQGLGGGNGGDGVVVGGKARVVIGANVAVKGGEGGDPGRGGRRGAMGRRIVYADEAAAASQGSGVPSTGATAEVQLPEPDAAVAAALSAAFSGARVRISADAAGNPVVALLADVERTVELGGDLGPITIDLNGMDMEGTDGADGFGPSDGADGSPALVVGPSDGSNPTVVTITSSRRRGEIEGGEGGDGVKGGNGGAAIVAGRGAKVVISGDVAVKGGEGGDGRTARSGDGGAGAVGDVTVKRGTVSGGKAGKSRAGRGAAGLRMMATPVPAWSVGSYSGVGAEGFVTLTVARGGKVSGKYVADGLSWTLAAASFDGYDAERGVVELTLVARRGRETAAVAATIVEDAVGATVECDLFAARRGVWAESEWKSVAKAFRKASSLVAFAEDLDGNPAEIALSLSTSGKVTAKTTYLKSVNARTGRQTFAKASNGTTIVPLAEADATGAFAAVVPVYFPPKGAFAGLAAEVPVEWDGSDWRVSDATL